MRLRSLELLAGCVDRCAVSHRRGLAIRVFADPMEDRRGTVRCRFGMARDHGSLRLADGSFQKGCGAQKTKGRDVLTPDTGTGMPSQERFRARPCGACLESCLVSEIASFELDSSRSYAKSDCVVVGYRMCR